jgi:ATP-dependent DNA helicase DinG
VTDDLSSLVSAEGPFARALARWQPRLGQARMARAVAACLDEGGVSLVEAGAGTGKTLAYLVPAVLSGRKVIVSTGTRTLQDQLFFKDIPLVRRALGTRFQAALLKGRANYLCLRRFGQFDQDPLFPRRSDAALQGAIRAWASATTTGDRAELDELPDDFTPWRLMSATSEQCLGQKCKRYDECFVFRARRGASAADVVVVNHHLFFADLAVRLQGPGEVLPRADAVIFDEAHQIEQVATLFLGRSVSSGRLADLLADVERERARGRRREVPPEALRAAVEGARASGEAFFNTFRGKEGRRRIEGGTLCRGTLHAARESLDYLGEAIAQTAGPANEALAACALRAREISTDLVSIVEERDADHVAWAEARGNQVTLTSAPIELGRAFEERIFSKTRSVLFTSATLSGGADAQGEPNFHFVRARLGLPPDVPAFAVESPFDYARQSLLYLPRLGILPDTPGFAEHVAEEIARIVAASGGRAFALFTSHRNLEMAASRLRGRLDYPMLVQGEGSKSALLDSFKAGGNAVLLATASFWEGVDVPGPALSCVIVDKLPFASPGDPIEEARIARLVEQGENAFWGYQLPRAILSLRQGLGRLIRNEQDVGVLALLDERVHLRSYGPRILASLPPCPRTSDLEDVIRFFASGAGFVGVVAGPPGSSGPCAVPGQADGAAGR